MLRLCWLRLLIVCLTVSSNAVAQIRLAEQTPFDTIGLMQKRTFFTPDLYAYHAATRLSGPQVIPLLLQSPDSAVQRLARRARRRYWLPLPMTVGSYGLLMGSARAGRLGNEALAGGLALGGLAVLVDGLVLGLSAPTAMRRATKRYNQMVRYAGDAYTDPLRDLRSEAFALTLADTIGIKPALLGSRYTYRQVAVVPDLQLTQAMQSLNDPYLSEGIRQNRVVRGIGGLIGGLSAAYLTSYGLTRLLLLAAGYRVREGVGPLFYASLGGVAVSFVLGGVANRTVRRITSRYNERLRTLEP